MKGRRARRPYVHGRRENAHRTLAFGIRSPAESLSSMLEAEVVPSPEGAVEHYIRQLTWVSRLTSQVEYESTAFLTYDNIVHKTDEVLDGLGNFWT